MRYIVLVIAIFLGGQFASATPVPLDTTDVVTLLSPVPNETLKNAPVRFKWARVENAIDYLLYIFADSLGNEPIAFFKTGDTSKLVLKLPFDSTMWWVVFAKDELYTLTSKRQMFRIANPYPLKLLSPSDSTKQDSLVEILSWHSVPNVTSYEVELVKAGSYEHYYTRPSISDDTTVSLPPLTSPQEYLWHVRPIWQDSVGAYSPYWTFQIFNKFPDPPKLGSPRDSTTFTQVDSSARVRVFEWGYDGADHYQIQLSYTRDFDSLLIDDSLMTRTYTVTLPYREGAHFWRVRIRHDYGWTDWSEVRSFFVHFLNHVQGGKHTEVYLYPNPSTVYVNIIGIVDHIADIKLTNVLGGSYHLPPTYQDRAVRLEIDEIPAGIYFLRITTIHGEQIIHQIAVRK
ncbi:MAG TPA: T9SS type A sorting domain-containing protein [Candidatus Kapabacteria bacterium]